jgi:hypothetical protein
MPEESRACPVCGREMLPPSIERDVHEWHCSCGLEIPRVMHIEADDVFKWMSTQFGVEVCKAMLPQLFRHTLWAQQSNPGDSSNSDNVTK